MPQSRPNCHRQPSCKPVCGGLRLAGVAVGVGGRKRLGLTARLLRGAVVGWCKPPSKRGRSYYYSSDTDAGSAQRTHADLQGKGLITALLMLGRAAFISRSHCWRHGFGCAMPARLLYCQQPPVIDIEVCRGWGWGGSATVTIYLDKGRASMSHTPLGVETRADLHTRKT